MKLCQGCGAVIPVPVDLRPSRWAAQRFCSPACASRSRRGYRELCAVEGCVNVVRALSQWCNLHRQRARKHGDPLYERWPDLLTRVMRSIRKGDCWEWQKSLFLGTGYGQVHVGNRNRLAHRVVYELLVGPIPAGLELDHLCRNRKCVNPAHLEPVTGKENIRRGHAARKAMAST